MKRIGRPLRDCDATTLTGKPSFASSSDIFDVLPPPRAASVPVSSAYPESTLHLGQATGLALVPAPKRRPGLRTPSNRASTSDKAAAARSEAWAAARQKRSSKAMKKREDGKGLFLLSLRFSFYPLIAPPVSNFHSPPMFFFRGDVYSAVTPPDSHRAVILIRLNC